VRTKLGNAPAAHITHVLLVLADGQIEDLFDPRLAAGGDAVKRRAANQNGLGSERQP
jgi:hypothetical protein